MSDNKRIQQASTVLVTRELKIGQYKKEVVDERQTLEEIEVHSFVTESAAVRVSKGFTIGMGEFQFARFDVGVTLPCYAEEVPDAYEVANKFCEEKLQEEAKSIQNFFQSRNSK